MIEATRTTSAAPEQLWRILSDVERWGDLLPTFDEVRRAGGPDPTGPGSRFRVRQPRLAPSTYEVSRWDVGGGFTWQSASPGLTVVADHRIEATPAGTQLTLTVNFAGVLSPIACRLLGTRTQRMIASEADTLTRLAQTH